VSTAPCRGSGSYRRGSSGISLVFSSTARCHHYSFLVQDGAEQVGSGPCGVTHATQDPPIQADGLAHHAALLGQSLADLRVRRICVQLLQDPPDGGFRRSLQALGVDPLQGFC
jgi:hypothetical protein